MITAAAGQPEYCYAAKAGPSLNHTEVTMDCGTTCKLKIRNLPKTVTVIWTSSDAGVVDLSCSAKAVQRCKLKAKGPGTADVRVKIKSKSKKKILHCAVTVNEPVLDQTSLCMAVGEEVPLKVLGSRKPVDWKSSDPDIATVSPKGLVTGVSEGEAIITAETCGLTLECCLKVAGTAETPDTVAIEYMTDFRHCSAELPWSPFLFEDMDLHSRDLALLAGGLAAAAYTDKGGKNPTDYFIGQAYAQLGLETTLYNFSNETDLSPLIAHKRTWALHQDIPDPRDEHCFAIGYTDMNLSGEKTHVLVIALRGTSNTSLGEVMKDYLAAPTEDLQGRKVYDYWSAYAAKVVNGLDIFVQDHPELQTGPVKILVGGHSLGGGGANLFGARLDYWLKGYSDPALEEISWEGPRSTDDVLVVTFGALNALGEPLTKLTAEAVPTDHPCSDMFSNIKNVFNELDTYGPKGEGTSTGIANNVHPAGGDVSCGRKYGPLKYFTGKNYNEIFALPKDRYANHSMRGYLDAIEVDAASFWSEAYKAHVEQAGRFDETAFTLLDLDDDAVPELIAQNGELFGDNQPLQIYTAAYGKIRGYSHVSEDLLQRLADADLTDPLKIKSMGWELFIQACADQQSEAAWAMNLEEHYK